MSSKEKSEGKSEKTTECQLIEVFSQMREDGCEFFLSSQLCPNVKIPDDGFQQEWPADSQRIQDSVISRYYEATQKRITTSERDFLMALLREECRKGEAASLRPSLRHVMTASSASLQHSEFA